MTLLERVDTLSAIAKKQNDVYIKNSGHPSQYHLGYIAALRAVRQSTGPETGDQSPIIIRLKPPVCACCGEQPCKYSTPDDSQNVVKEIVRLRKILSGLLLLNSTGAILDRLNELTDTHNVYTGELKGGDA